MELNLRSNDRALSLLELLVTVAILTIGIVTILQGMSFSARLTGLSCDIVQVSFLAEDRLQELGFKEKQGWLEQIPQALEEETGKYKWNYELIPETDEDLYRLNLEVNWQRANRDEKIALSTYLR